MRRESGLPLGASGGTYQSVEVRSRVELLNDTTEPDPERVERHESYYNVYRSLYPATREAMRSLSGLAVRPPHGD